MTWGEFKAWMEQHGVTDDDRIGHFDFEGRPLFDKPDRWTDPVEITVIVSVE